MAIRTRSNRGDRSAPSLSDRRIEVPGRNASTAICVFEDSQQPDHINDLFDGCCSFCQNAFIDYVQEEARIAEIGAWFARKTANRLRQDEKRLFENMAVQTVN